MPIPARPALARTRANRAVPESIGGGDRRPMTRDQADQTDVRRHTLGISPTWGTGHKEGTRYWPVHTFTVSTGRVAGSTRRRNRRCGHYWRLPALPLPLIRRRAPPAHSFHQPLHHELEKLQGPLYRRRRPLLPLFPLQTRHRL